MHLEAVFRTDLPAASRERAAYRFRAVVAELDENRAALPPFIAALTDADGDRRNAAARALAETHWPEVTERLLNAYATREPFLEDITLSQLGKQTPLPDGAWQLLERVLPFQRGSLVVALLRRPSAIAEQRWDEVVAGDDDGVAFRAIDVVARWGRPELLRALLLQPRRPVPKGLPPELRPRDIRLPAAFQLGLRGGRDGIEFLIEASASSDAEHAVAASLCLAELGLPAGVAPVARHLKGRNRHVIELALSAAQRLCTPTLGPALCALAERPGSRGFPSLPDDALRTLAKITGLQSADPAGDDGSATPPEARSRAATLQRSALAGLDASLRYHNGEPLALGHLVQDLTSIHQGPVRGAAYALHAITGEDLGFDPDADLIANLDALEAWRARAERPAPTAPGEWGFQGELMSPPELPV